MSLIKLIHPRIAPLRNERRITLCPEGKDPFYHPHRGFPRVLPDTPAAYDLLRKEYGDQVIDLYFYLVTVDIAQPVILFEPNAPLGETIIALTGFQIMERGRPCQVYLRDDTPCVRRPLSYAFGIPSVMAA